MVVVVTSIVLVILPGQSRPSETPSGWLGDYREALRCELIDGDLRQAVTAYRRVIVSRAPRTYAQRAQYRLANVLTQLGQVDEAKNLLRSLSEELPKGELLRNEVSRLLAHRPERLHDVAYWADQLIRAAKSFDLDPLKKAAGVLARAEGSDGVGVLLDVYNKLSPADASRAVLLPYLARAEALDAVGVIREALEEARADLAAAAAVAVGELGDAGSADKLVALLSRQEPRVREQAARALGRLRHLPAIDRLIERAKTDESAAVRRAAAGALDRIGSSRAVQALSAMKADAPPDDDGLDLSPWYRRAVSETSHPQLRFVKVDDKQTQARAPRIGVVVSAMSHHARSWDRLYQPYARQVRKAWTFQRAGFDVCLLAEPEVNQDPQANGLEMRFCPPLKAYALGQWPDCDVLVLDELYHLPLTVVKTVQAFCEAGGRALICGAVASGWCGDGVSARELVGVRRLRSHRFRTDQARLVWRPRDDAGRIPDPRRDAWVTRRTGSFYAYAPLKGAVLAAFDSPHVWAVKSHRVGRGRVMCLNWGIGMNTDGTRDEDELLCRCIDVLIGREPKVSPPRYRMMRYVRWGDLSTAKACIDAEQVVSIRPAERVETVAQLHRIYRLENNRLAGRRVCRGLLAAFDRDGTAGRVLDDAARAPKRLQMAVDRTGRAIWWLDVPDWLRPLGEIPLWLAGPATLPARVRFRVWPGQDNGLRIATTGARLEAVRSDGGTARYTGAEGRYEVTCETRLDDTQWIDLDLVMTDWSARIRLQIADGG